MSELQQRSGQALSSRQTQSNQASNEQKALSILNKSKENNRNTSMAKFDEIVGVYIGTEAKKHFPYFRDSAGNKVKETVNGRERDKRSKESDGWTHYFNELGTGKIIQVILTQKHDLKLFGLYSISGLGYDMKQSQMFFIEKDATLSVI